MLLPLLYFQPGRIEGTEIIRRLLNILNAKDRWIKVLKQSHFSLEIVLCTTQHHAHPFNFSCQLHNTTREGQGKKPNPISYVHASQQTCWKCEQILGLIIPQSSQMIIHNRTGQKASLKAQNQLVLICVSPICITFLCFSNETRKS